MHAAFFLLERRKAYSPLILDAQSKQEGERERGAHTKPQNPTSSPLCLSALFASAYCFVALTLDFCQGLSIKTKQHSHMLWQTGGEGKEGFIFREKQNAEIFKSE